MLLHGTLARRRAGSGLLGLLALTLTACTAPGLHTTARPLGSGTARVVMLTEGAVTYDSAKNSPFLVQSVTYEYGLPFRISLGATFYGIALAGFGKVTFLDEDAAACAIHGRYLGGAFNQKSGDVNLLCTLGQRDGRVSLTLSTGGWRASGYAPRFSTPGSSSSNIDYDGFGVRAGAMTELRLNRQWRFVFEAAGGAIVTGPNPGMRTLSVGLGPRVEW